MRTQLKRIYRLLDEHVIVILSILLSSGFIIAILGTYYLTTNLLDSQAEYYAQVSVRTLNAARQLYSSNVVDNLNASDEVIVAAKYHNIKSGIPNPATYTIELGEHLSEESRGMLFRLYSNYPFPNRQATGGPQDAFQRQALEYLEKHPKGSYVLKERKGDHLVFRYAEPILMEASCVRCHNRLPNSPRKDWKIGQVRGVVEITQPLDGILLVARDGLQLISAVLASFIALAIAGLILVVRKVHGINRELKVKVSERTRALQHLANLDGLTRLANRRKFDHFLDQEWQRAKRGQYDLSLILCDVDFFKNYNDAYGHQLGDDCLCKIAEVLQSCVKRAGELAARYGGEEFALVLPNADASEAVQVAEAIQAIIRELQIPHQASVTHSYVTLSIGIATVTPTLSPQDDQSPQHLIKLADAALYQAKSQGRDRFVSLKNQELQPHQ